MNMDKRSRGHSCSLGTVTDFPSRASKKALYRAKTVGFEIKPDVLSNEGARNSGSESQLSAFDALLSFIRKRANASFSSMTLRSSIAKSNSES